MSSVRNKCWNYYFQIKRKESFPTFLLYYGLFYEQRGWDLQPHSAVAQPAV